MKKKKRLYPLGGILASIGGIADAASIQEDGRLDESGSILGGAASGASAGSILGPWGAVAGGLIGGIKGLRDAKKMNKELELEDRKVAVMERKEADGISRAVLAANPTQGVRMKSLYMKGGHLASMSSNVKQAIGDSHGQDTNADGQPGITVNYDNAQMGEIEGGELVVDNTKILSNTIGVNGRSYADIGRSIISSPGYAKYNRVKEKAIKTQSNGGVYASTAKRTLSRPDPIEEVFVAQEQSKAAQAESMQGAPAVMRYGGSFPVINKAKLGMDLIKERAGDLLPYADNIANALINKNAPKIPVPRLTAAPRLNTTFNVDDQLAAIDTASYGRDRNLMATSANATTTRNNLLAGTAGDVTTRNQVLGDKQRQEVALQNAQIQATYQNTAANNQQLAAYDTNKMYRVDDMQQRASQNVADASTNAQQQRLDKKLDMRDKQVLALTAMKYAESGVLSRADLAGVLDRIEQGYTLEDAMSGVQSPKMTTAQKLQGTLQKLRANPALLKARGRLAAKGRKDIDAELGDLSTIYDNIFTSGNYGNV